jgi:hypothetical protein
MYIIALHTTSFILGFKVKVPKGRKKEKKLSKLKCAPEMQRYTSI